MHDQVEIEKLQRVCADGQGIAGVGLESRLSSDAGEYEEDL